jgi:mycoredoxin
MSFIAKNLLPLKGNTCLMSASPLNPPTSELANARQILMYTTSWCGDCRRAKRVFGDLGIPYTEVNIDEEPQAAEQVKQLNKGMRSVPTIVFADGTTLVEPTTMTLQAKLTSLNK